MKAQQVTSLLLCALLSTTLAHDYLRAKYLGAKDPSSNQISPFENRANINYKDLECSWQCDSDTIIIEGSLEILINATNELVAVYNSSASAAILFDIKANIIGLFNGTSGEAVFINLKNQTVLYIAANQSTETWLRIRQGCFKIYFSSLSSLQFFFDLKVGKTISFKQITQEILEIIGRHLAHFASSLALRFQHDVSESLQTIIKIGTSIFKLFSGSLKGFLQFAGKAFAFHLHGDILWLVGIFEGLEKAFGAISGGLSALIKAKVEFDLAVLFAAANGIEFLVNFLLAIVPHVSLAQLGNLFNSVEDIIELIVKLGGSVSFGATGVFNIIWQFILLTRGKIELEAFLEIALKFGASRRGQGSLDIEADFEGLEKIIEIQNSVHGQCRATKILARFIQQLRSGNLEIGGVNVSNIIKQLAGPVTNVLQLVVSVLLLITKVVQFVVSIPGLLFYLLGKLLTSEGAAFLEIIIPGLNITASTHGSSGGNILQQILKGLNFSNVISLLTGNIWHLLQSIPVVREIVSALASAIKAASKNSSSLQSVLQSSGARGFIEKIKNLIKETLHGKSSTSTVTTKPSSWYESWTWSWSS